MSRWVWGKEGGARAGLAKPPFSSLLLCSPSLAGSRPARSAWLKWTAALKGQPSLLKGAFVAHCWYCLLHGAMVAPCRAFPTLHILSWRANWGLPERAGGLNRVKPRAGFTALVWETGPRDAGPALCVPGRKRLEMGLLTSESPSTLRCYRSSRTFNPNTHPIIQTFHFFFFF